MQVFRGFSAECLFFLLFFHGVYFGVEREPFDSIFFQGYPRYCMVHFSELVKLGTKGEPLNNNVLEEKYCDEEDTLCGNDIS